MLLDVYNCVAAVLCALPGVVPTCFVTIDRGAKYRISGARATPERKEHAI